MATGIIQPVDIARVTECYYGYGSTTSGFIKQKKPTRKPGRDYKPTGIMSTTNGIMCMIAYENPSDNTEFYIKCLKWDMSIPADGTSVGYYVSFSTYLSGNLPIE